MNKHYEMDMTEGNLFLKMIRFSIPLILTGVLQLLYNAADLLVVSNFSGDKDALGAVGSTGSLINLIVNLFMGLSVGTNVLVARMYASKNDEGMSKVVHTAIITSFVIGIGVGVFGIFTARPLLHLMSNPIELSIVYLRIYFFGLPFNLLYNFCAAILRGVGDTKRPLYFLSIAGLINFLLNLLFVIVFKMSVAGVALATIISQFISCVLIIICLMKTKESYHFSFKKLNISTKELREMMRIGLPAGLQSSIFSISNVLIQSSVNAFGATAINGNSAAQSLEGFVYTSMNSVYHASLSFTSQNLGARKTNNINKILIYSLIIVTMIGIIMGGAFFLLGRQLLSIYTRIADEINVGYIRLHYLTLVYFLCGIMDVTCGVIRGLGYAILPMIVSLVGACGLRILWILFIFRPYTSFTNLTDLNMLYISYPISWIITFATHLICFFICSKKVKRRLELSYNID